MLKLSLSGARAPHVNSGIRYQTEPQIDTDWILPKTTIKKSLGKSSHSKFSHCCLTISRCSTVTGFVLQYKWLLKLWKGQIIIEMICETVSKEHQAQTGFLPSLFRLCTPYEGFQEYPSFFNLLKIHTQAIPTVPPVRRAMRMIRGL